MIRVLIVDDSLTMRRGIAERLEAAGMAVVGEAADGQEAVSRVRSLKPDVVLMDVVMPHMDGVEATRRIMCECPTPIVIMTSHTDKRELLKTNDALVHGALAICPKPAADSRRAERAWDRLVLALVAAARADQLTSPAARHNAWASTGTGDRDEHSSPWPYQLVLIGASTGGPQAVATVLEGLPDHFPAAVVVAVHGNRRVSMSLADCLQHSCRLPVRQLEREERIALCRGEVLVCFGPTDVVFDRGAFRCAPAVSDELTPSIDRLFASVAEHCGRSTIGVLLTGMGTDGAEGLRRIRDCGGFTIAQDEQSSAVFGMPAAAIECGAARQILPLKQISECLVDLTMRVRLQEITT